MAYFSDARCEDVPSGSELLSAGQRVGTAPSCYIVRDLYRAPNGDIYSVTVSGPSFTESRSLRGG